MAVISVSNHPQDIWSVAGWAFRQLLQDVTSEFSDDAELIQEFESAGAMKALTLETLEPDLAQRITHALRHVIRGILDGSIRSSVKDQYQDRGETERIYRESLGDLQRILSQ